MTQQKKQTIPPPGVISAIVAGFDAVTNHIALILFPIGLDLLLWLAPHLRVKNIIEAWLTFASQSRGEIASFTEMSEMMGGVEKMWLLSAERFNLLGTLRSYPVGVPSLTAGSPLMARPWGEITFIDISSVWIALLMAGAFTVAGLIVGAFYFSLVSQVALFDEIRLLKSLADWPRASLQVILLAFMWLFLILGISIPVSCGMMLFALAGIPGISFAVVIFGSILMWVAFPLLFAPHGILTNRSSLWPAIRKSVQIIRMTLPSTATFIVSLVFINQILDMLWIIPPENSWLTLLGFTGHAFATTGLLSASFVYYQQASQWVQSILDHQSAQATTVAG